MDVFLVNPKATRMLRYPRWIKEIEAILPEGALLIRTTSAKDTLGRLNEISATLRIARLIVVGGDGIGGTAINWKYSIPEPIRPVTAFMSGGNICFYAELTGFRTNDPIWNLNQLYDPNVEKAIVEWQPVKITIDATREVLYCGVYGNGLLFNFLEWMDKSGKRTALSVGWMIAKSIASAIRSRGESGGILKGTCGDLIIDGKQIVPYEHLTVIIGAVEKLSLGSTPFAGKRKPGQIWCASYWGNFTQLAKILPSVWRGHVPTHAEAYLYNSPASKIVYRTVNSGYMHDGDTRHVPVSAALKNDGVITFTFTLGEPIKLLTLVR